MKFSKIAFKKKQKICISTLALIFLKYIFIVLPTVATQFLLSLLYSQVNLTVTQHFSFIVVRVLKNITLSVSFQDFLMWTIFKVLTEFVTILPVLVFWPQGMQDFSSPTPDQAPTPCTGRRSLNHWTARDSLCGFFFFLPAQLNCNKYYPSQTKFHL